MEKKFEYKTRLINDIVIKNIKNNDSKKLIQKDQQKDISDMIFPGIMILGKPGSGKGILIYNLLKIYSKKSHTKIIFFSSTIYTDKTYHNIIKKLNKKGYNFVCHDKFIEDNKNLLDYYFQEMKNDAIEESNSKYYQINYIICIDDMQYNQKILDSIENIVLRRRHIKTIPILCHQYYNGFKSPSIRTNTNVMCIFSNLSTKKLKDIFEEKILSIFSKMTFDEFIDIYVNATKEKYNFLFINENQIRQNFNREILI